MSSRAIIFFSVGLVFGALLVWLFIQFIKKLGTRKSELGEVLKDNSLIILPSATMLIFAFWVAILLWLYVQLFGSIFN